MASSAQELTDTLKNFQNQYSTVHLPNAQSMQREVTSQVERLVQDGSQWIGAEVAKLENDWNIHSGQLTAIINHFESTVVEISRIIEVVSELMAMAGGE